MLLTDSHIDFLITNSAYLHDHTLIQLIQFNFLLSYLIFEKRLKFKLSQFCDILDVL